jgi:hypothetical protein
MHVHIYIHIWNLSLRRMWLLEVLFLLKVFPGIHIYLYSHSYLYLVHIDAYPYMKPTTMRAETPRRASTSEYAYRYIHKYIFIRMCTDIHAYNYTYGCLYTCTYMKPTTMRAETPWGRASTSVIASRWMYGWHHIYIYIHIY